MTVADKRDDLFMIQVRLYRMIQNRLDLSPDECKTLAFQTTIWFRPSRPFKKHLKILR